MQKYIALAQEVAKPVKHKTDHIVKCVNLGTFNSCLYHTITPGIILGFSFICFYPFFFSGPIVCYLQGRESSTTEAPPFVNSFCFTSSHYVLQYHNEIGKIRNDPYPGYGPENDGSQRQSHNYYQYVPYMLILQLILFRVPYYLWKRGGHQENGLIAKLAGYLDADVEMAIVKKKVPTREKMLREKMVKADEDIDILQGVVDGTVEGHAGAGDGKMNPKKDAEENRKKEDAIRKKVDQVADYLYDRRGSLKAMGFNWILVDVMALVIIVANFLLLNWFLGGIFLSYGMTAIKSNNINHVSEVYFPRMTKCRLNKYGASGTLENRDVTCLLTLNMYFSYIFLFLWFWYIMLGVITVLSLIIKPGTIAIMKWRPSAFTMKTLGRPTRIVGSDLAVCTRGLTLSDCVLLYLLGSNLRPITYQTLVANLANKFRSRSGKYIVSR